MPVNPIPVLRRVALLAVVAAACAPAAGQTIYRCEENGRTIYVDKPCPNGRAVDAAPRATPKAPPAAAAPAAPTPAPTPAPGKTAARPTPSAPAALPPGQVPPGLGYGTREQQCSGGNRKACDELACLRDDREACQRIGGLRGSGWHEVSRHTETQRGKNDLGKPVLRRVLVVKLQCAGKPPRSGEVLLGRHAIHLRNNAIDFSSIDTAAAALCKR